MDFSQLNGIMGLAENGKSQNSPDTVDQFILLTKTLKDILANIDDDNLSDSFLRKFDDLNGNISALNQTAYEFSTQLTNAEGNISQIKQTTDVIELGINNSKYLFTEDGLIAYGAGFKIMSDTTAEAVQMFGIDENGTLIINSAYNSYNYRIAPREIDGIISTTFSHSEYGDIGRIEAQADSADSKTLSIITPGDLFLPATGTIQLMAITGAIYFNSQTDTVVLNAATGIHLNSTTGGVSINGHGIGFTTVQDYNNNSIPVLTWL